MLIIGGVNINTFITMLFDPENPIIKLCAQGMEMEGAGQPAEALKIFQQAWDEASNNLEKFSAAHYVARHQNSVADKLKWDQTALQLALDIKGDEIKGAYPSLYLNIAKCHEDLKDFEKAKQNYELALSHADFLHDDGYGNMIKAGITNGIARVSQ
jgi:tetratricopeptide (TPR) repeat protein